MTKLTVKRDSVQTVWHALLIRRLAGLKTPIGVCEKKGRTLGELNAQCMAAWMMGGFHRRVELSPALWL